MRRTLLVLCCLLLIAGEAAAGLSSRARRKTYVAGELYTAADVNADNDAGIAYDNLIAAYFPGDTLKVIMVATDSLVSKTLNKIMFKHPLVGDSVRSTAISAQRSWVDTAKTNTKFSAGLTVPPGQTATIVAVDGDTINVDSLTLSAGGKLKTLAGTVSQFTAITPDSILGNPKVTGTPIFSAGFSALSANINSGTIDGTVIGGTTTAAGSFTTAKGDSVRGTAISAQRSWVDTARSGTVFAAGMKVPAGQTATLSAVDGDTINVDSLTLSALAKMTAPAGASIVLSAVDVDSLLGAGKATGLWTFLAGLTVPPGQTATISKAALDTLANAVLAQQALTVSGLITANGGLTVPATKTLTGAAGSIFTLKAVTPDTIKGTPILAGGATLPAEQIFTGAAGSIVSLKAVTPDSILGNVKLTGSPSVTLDLLPATDNGPNLGSVAATWDTLFARGILVDGNVGIGIAVPVSTVNGSAAVLHIYKNAATGAGLKAESSATLAEMCAGNGTAYLYTDDQWAIFAGAAQRMLIDAAGNVGIGVTPSTGQLEMAPVLTGDSAAIQRGLYINATTSGTATSSNPMGIFSVLGAGYTGNNGTYGIYASNAVVGNPVVAVNYGILGTATGAGLTSIGGSFSASGATNNYGLNITGPTAGATNYAIYSSAAAQSYIAGSVGIGGAPTVFKLEVTGNVGPAADNTYDLGSAAASWDSLWIHVAAVVGDMKYQDNRDDVADIQAIKGSGVFGADGIELVDDSTLPKDILVLHTDNALAHRDTTWLETQVKQDSTLVSYKVPVDSTGSVGNAEAVWDYKYRTEQTVKAVVEVPAHRKGDPILNPDGKPYVDLLASDGKVMGAIRQQAGTIAALEQRVADLEAWKAEQERTTAEILERLAKVEVR